MSSSTTTAPWTVKQAAEHAQVHPKTLLKALRRGELLGYQRGANCAWRIFPADLERWVMGEPPVRRRRSA